MQRTVARKLYLTGLVLAIILGLFASYKLIVASILVKLIVAASVAICVYVPPVADPVGHWVYETYCKDIFIEVLRFFVNETILRV